MTEHSEELLAILPCPFCGGTDLRVVAACYIKCRSCGTEGPIYDGLSDDEATIKQWNTRSDTALTEALARVKVLEDALERLDRNFDLLLAGKPVRDVAETKAETRAALKGTDLERLQAAAKSADLGEGVSLKGMSANDRRDALKGTDA